MGMYTSAGIQIDLGFINAEAGHESIGVKDELTVAVVNPFWHSRRARGVKRGGHGCLRQNPGNRNVALHAESSASYSPERFKGCWRRRIRIRQKDEFLDGLDLILDGFQHGKKIGIDQNDVIFGMIDGVRKLLRR